MGQYKQGTISITAEDPNIVTGSGTLWLANIVAGSAFKVFGDNAIYEVASVDSNTQLHLSANYANPPVSGAAYEVNIDWTTYFGFSEIWAGDKEWQYHATVNFIRKLDTLLNSMLQGKLSKSVAGNQDITLTSTECMNRIVEFTGELTGNINVIFPASPSRCWVVNNKTTGNYVLTVKTATQNPAMAPQVGQLYCCEIYANGTNIVRITPDTGEIYIFS